MPKPDAPAPSLPHDLKNVTVSRLRGLSDVQLRKLCEERALPLVADAGGPQMLTALLQFRAKQGRSRRAAGSSGGLGGGGSSGGGGGSGDGLGSDDEQSRQWEEDKHPFTRNHYRSLMVIFLYIYADDTKKYCNIC